MEGRADGGKEREMEVKRFGCWDEMRRGDGKRGEH